MKRRVVTTCAALLSAVFLLGACSSDDTETASSATSRPTTTTKSKARASSTKSDAPSSTKASTTALAVPAMEDDSDICSPRRVSRDLGREYEFVDRCDGEWAYATLKVEQKVGDATGIMRFRNGKWEKYTWLPATDVSCEQAKSDGIPRHFLASFNMCDVAPTTPTNPSLVTAQGLPEYNANGQPTAYMGNGRTGLVGGVMTKSRGLVTSEYLQCDGRGLLIVESWIEEPGDPQQSIADLIDMHPGASFTSPGSCASLRKYVDSGARIYPIYFDFGFDREALCNAKARMGGNARIAQNVVDYSDPC